MFFQRIKAQNNNPRQDTHAASIAYNDGTGRQRLLRWIMRNQYEGNDLIWYLSDNYVDKPNDTEQMYDESAYSNIPIYLDDLASAKIIADKATDTYAKQPLSSNDAKDNKGSTEPRSYRTAVDNEANDATKYLYSMAKWADRSFKTDMWNEPILMFRYTRAYDRGEGEYATRTTDGHYLTLYKDHRWLTGFNITEEDASLWDELEEENYTGFFNEELPVHTASMPTPDTWHLNGKTISFPKWNDIKD